LRPVKLVTDSTSDLSEDVIKQYDIAIIPLYVNFGENSFKDNVDIKTTDLFQKVKETGMLPKTSAPSVTDFVTEFKRHIDQGLDILHISISSNISASFQNACTAAQQFPEGRIRVIDSFSLSSGIGILVMYATDFLQQGLDLEKTYQKVLSLIDKVRVEFIINTLDYLYKGGRCSGLQMLLSSILEIHPIIGVTAGKMHVTAKIRGNRKSVLSRLTKDALDNMEKMDGKYLFLTHCDSADDASIIKKQIMDLNKVKNICINNASCVVSSHCGPKTIGIIYMIK
jgi:DegV family protein with EDD domain